MTDRKIYLNATAGLWLPLGAAIITGMIGAVLGGAAVIVFELTARPWSWVVAGGASGLLSGWLAAWGWWKSQASYQLEELHPKEVIHRIELPSPDNRHVTIARLTPIDPGKLIDFAREVCDGASLSEGVWICPGRFKRREYTQLRDTLIRRKLGYWKSDDPARGWALTYAGKAVLRYFAGLEPIDVEPPPLQLNDWN